MINPSSGNQEGDSVEVLARWGRGRAAFRSVDERRQPIGHIHSRRWAGQDVIAQGAQHKGFE